MEAETETKSGKSTADDKRSKSGKRVDLKSVKQIKSKGKPVDVHEEQKNIRQSPVRHTEGLKRTKKLVGKQTKKKIMQPEPKEAKPTVLVK